MSAGQVHASHELVDAGADVNATNEKGQTPLYVCPHVFRSQPRLSGFCLIDFTLRPRIIWQYASFLLLHRHMLILSKDRPISNRKRRRRKALPIPIFPITSNPSDPSLAHVDKRQRPRFSNTPPPRGHNRVRISPPASPQPSRRPSTDTSEYGGQGWHDAVAFGDGERTRGSGGGVD